MNKFWLFLIVPAVIGAVVVVRNRPAVAPGTDNLTPVTEIKKTIQGNGGPCREEAVDLPNYGDKGKRLKNCFVEYPGEPSRQDKNYYIVEDICGQFTQEFIQNLLGKPIVKVEPPKFDGIYNCTYYLDDKNYLMLNLNYLPIANQKAFYERKGVKVENSPLIKLENMVVWDRPDLISDIYFILGPNKFLSIRPFSAQTINNQDFLDFAVKLGQEIKDYK